MKPTRRFRAMPQSTEQQPVRKPPMSPKVGRDLIAKLREKYNLQSKHRQRSAFATKWPVPAFDEQLNLF